MSDHKSSARAAARSLVQNILDDHGYLAPEIYDRMDAEMRRAVEHAMMKKDEQAGWSIVTLAKNIYSSNARFVFELLQNCDDNHYSRARSRNQDPYVSFKIFSDRLIMSSNEDGFTKENLNAICSVGKSSKMGAQGYIGEKGIGFKSVFMAAYKVLIQSGDFSFYFQHRKGDLGLGMITPVWQDHDERVSDDLSQITLYLHHDDNDGDDTPLRQRIRQQFHNIHDDILLFMKNMRRIDVTFYDDEGSEELSITHSIEWNSNVEATAKKSITDYQGRTVLTNRYLVARHMATNLAPNENRSYSEEEKAVQAYSRSEIVLAFPLDPESNPRCENQWVFAFLPIRQMGFKFLIQADFVTEASRQDIVTSSPRNKSLGVGIADAFIEAVLQFSKHDKLQWSWMRYIPQKDAYAWDGFWSRILDQIGLRLCQTRIIQLDCSPRLELLSDCKKYSPSLLDKDGKFLLPDQFRKHYVSLKYHLSDLALLTPYGLANMDMSECVKLVSIDLSNPLSIFRNTDDEDWHSRMARLLYTPFKQNWTAIQDEVKQLAMLPLRNSNTPWVSKSTRQIYYPLVSGDPQKVGSDLAIPDDLELHVMEPIAVQNDSRRQLFDAMGVQSASIKIVRDAIIQQCSKRAGQANHYCRPEHLHFLYRTQCVAESPFQYNKIKIYSNWGTSQNPQVNDYYIRPLPGVEDQDPYGANELLRTIAKDDKGASVPGLVVDYVNSGYFRTVPELPPGSSLTWKAWLHDYLHVRRYPRLVAASGERLSDIARYVAEYRPEKFIGFVQSVWSQEVETLHAAKKAKVVDELGAIKVLCTDGKKHTLRSTFPPTKDLKQLCARFTLDSEVYPWLQVETRLDGDDMPPDWKSFHKAMWLEADDSEAQSIRFLLDLLSELKKMHPGEAGVPQPERIGRLFVHIQADIRRSTQPEQRRKEVFDYFDAHYRIFIPKSETDESVWAQPKDCVWKSPINIPRTKFCLALIYENATENFAADKALLEDFFTSTLGVPNANWENLIDEIAHCDLQYAHDFEATRQLYTSLSQEQLGKDEEEQLRTRFCEVALIAGYKGTTPAWFKSTECLWSSGTQIGGMLTLNERYPELQKFFVKRIGVQKVTPTMIYHKLLRETLSIEDAKQTILTFTGFLQDSKELFEVEPMQERDVLPARLANGDLSLLNSSNEFAVLDRQSLGDDFNGKATCLDFTLDEVRYLRPFLAWLGLEGRYLSKLVKEITAADETSTSPISAAHRQMKRKAHSLLSIALAYNSPRVRQNPMTFYAMLKRSETLQTEKITSELHLKQKGQTLKVHKSTATLHIDDTADNLRLYVPKDEAKQEFCFSSKLPQQLCEWLMTNPATNDTESVPTQMVSAVQSVLTVKNANALPDILDHHGITPADAPFDEDVDDDISGSETVVVSSVGGGSSGSGYFSHNSSYSGRYSRPERDDKVDPELYKVLLLKVVDAARRYTIPAYGPYDTSELQAALSDVDIIRPTWSPNPLGSASGPERHRHIGAAGELFVFEILSRLTPSLPSFTRANWQSTIRHLTRLHPDYTDLTFWHGTETADLTYVDDTSALTEFLIDKGYLDREIWAEAKVKYYIEVKATTGACEQPFYLSTGQYQRMQRSSNGSARARKTSEIYVIFRVFNLGREDCGVRVLVDPESLRLKGKLTFSADPWIVVAN